MERTEIAEVITNELTRRRDEKVAELRARIERMNHRMTELTARLDSGGPIPGGGQVQSLGNELDLLCGQIALMDKLIHEVPQEIQMAESLQRIQQIREEK